MSRLTKEFKRMRKVWKIYRLENMLEEASNELMHRSVLYAREGEKDNQKLALWVGELRRRVGTLKREVGQGVGAEHVRHGTVTAVDQAEYLAYKGNRCPSCHKMDTMSATTTVQTDAGMGWQDFVCDYCGFELQDLYELKCFVTEDDMRRD